jgi:hypothetical protein
VCVSACARVRVCVWMSLLCYIEIVYYVHDLVCVRVCTHAGVFICG